MSQYKDEELKKSVYYPGCGTDFEPLLLFPESSLFIYVDYFYDCWSQSREEYLRKVSADAKEAPMQIQERPEQGDAQEYANNFRNLFQPISPQEYEDRIENHIREVEASRRVDWGLKGEILEALERLNPHLTLVDDGRLIPPGEIGIGEEPQWPAGFAMLPEEHQRWEETMANITPWAHEFRIAWQTRLLRVLYICGEGLFNSGSISPRVLVTIQAGGTGGCTFGVLNAPLGITEHLLRACERRPHLWVRGRGGENPEEGLYNILVEEYEGAWDEVAAFRQRTSKLENLTMCNFNPQTLIAFNRIQVTVNEFVDYWKEFYHDNVPIVTDDGDVQNEIINYEYQKTAQMERSGASHACISYW